jgi:hypothetical protein
MSDKKKKELKKSKEILPSNTSLSKRYENLYNTKTFSDFKFILEESKEEIYSHKIIVLGYTDCKKKILIPKLFNNFKIL